MALKNKDGSAYRLRGPNPLAKTQDHSSLKDDDIVLHNFTWAGTDVGDLDEIKPFPTDMNIKDNVLVIQTPKPVAELEPIEIKPKPVPVVKSAEHKPELVATIPIETPRPITASQFRITVSMFCLPSKYKTVRDEFNGEEYQRRTFGKKFSFEAVMVETGDLGIRFWTTVPLLTKGAIVYPYRYSDGQKYGEFRWWEIQSIESKSGGYLIDAIISSVQPDFSD